MDPKEHPSDAVRRAVRRSLVLDQWEREMDDDRRQGMPRREDDAERTLTDADVNAIVERFQEAVTKRFYTDIGRGVIASCKRALIIVLIGFAAYGSWKGMK
ncbi:hypothetical protein ACFPOE_11325 [Caenimonas terrae]|uniref:Uncharacterized protein n=1 Tax=Caenimonas terrae TaxID=696074 RepID=A0ABW0NFS1_9BURK